MVPVQGMIDAVLAFVRDNRDWAFWIALVFAFGENLAFLSIVIPSTAILLGVGALVATGQLSLLPIFAGASIGALFGSVVSYAIGWRYGQAILSLWPLRDHPDLVEKVNAAFRRWGAYAVTIGHFFGPLRATVPLMAGVFEMPQWLFQLANWSSAFLWAAVLLAPGAFGGDLWKVVTGWFF